jgi:hypothetical protein
MGSSSEGIICVSIYYFSGQFVRAVQGGENYMEILGEKGIFVVVVTTTKEENVFKIKH